jgi:hypothetical protein
MGPATGQMNSIKNKVHKVFFRGAGHNETLQFPLFIDMYSKYKCFALIEEKVLGDRRFNSHGGAVKLTFLLSRKASPAVTTSASLSVYGGIFFVPLAGLSLAIGSSC